MYHRTTLRRSAVVLTLAVMLCAAPALAIAADDTLPLELIKLPPGFSIEVHARVPGARALAFGTNGTLFAGSVDGRVFAIAHARNGNAQAAPVVRTIASGLRDPSGIAFHDGALYVSAVSRIVRFDDIERRIDSPPAPSVVTERLPGDASHGRKFIGFGPDGKLYVAVGAPCNICQPDPDRYAAILRMNADGSNAETFARGIRNSVGFDWDPRTRELWFTSNGRDWLGDDAPPDTLNHAARAGLHFGYPYCHAGTIADPEFGAKQPCSAFTPPAQALGPHVAALGMRFYAGAQFPERYRGQIFIAEHGSWNRSRKIGYRITLVRLDGAGKTVSYEPFAEGWLQGDRAWGRPADVAVAPDGSLMVSDDAAGAIYRIRYRG